MQSKSCLFKAGEKREILDTAMLPSATRAIARQVLVHRIHSKVHFSGTFFFSKNGWCKMGEVGVAQNSLTLFMYIHTPKAVAQLNYLSILLAQSCRTCTPFFLSNMLGKRWQESEAVLTLASLLHIPPKWKINQKRRLMVTDTPETVNVPFLGSSWDYSGQHFMFFLFFLNCKRSHLCYLVIFLQYLLIECKIIPNEEGSFIKLQAITFFNLLILSL